MSLFKVNVVACNPRHEDRRTLPIEVLEKIGVQPRRKRTFQTATK